MLFALTEAGVTLAVMSISITDGGEALEGFLMQCEEGLKSHILEAVLKAQEECTKSQEAIDEKCQGMSASS